MKKIGTSVFVVILFFSPFYNAIAQDGFRGIKWGTSIDSVQGMVYHNFDSSYGGIKSYIKKGDKLQMGSAKLTRILYDFWQGRFCSVTISTEGELNWINLKEVVFERFGRFYQPNKYIETYASHSGSTDMLLEYNEIAKKGVLFMTSREIVKEQEEYEKEKAKEGAENDF